jgi:Na+/proline symporter
LQALVFDKLQIPFWINVIFTILLIFTYTHKGGIRTIIWTDTLQTAALLGTLVLCIYYLAVDMGLSLSGVVNLISESSLSKTFFFSDVNDKQYFFKQFFAGVFTTITMTGLDQDLMQKNLCCKHLKDAKRNMQSYGLAFLPINILFLSLGVLLYVFMAQNGVAFPDDPDKIFPLIATGGFLPPIVGVLFIIGIVAAAYSSADSALTALTTSFTIDILGIKNDDAQLRKKRRMIHLGMCVAFAVLILGIHASANDSIINTVYKVAGYTYGPLLGLFAFGMFTKVPVHDRYVPVVAVLSPILSFVLSWVSPLLLNGYQIGFELLIVNGAITFLGLLLLRKRQVKVKKENVHYD